MSDKEGGKDRDVTLSPRCWKFARLLEMAKAAGLFVPRPVTASARQANHDSQSRAFSITLPRPPRTPADSFHTSLSKIRGTPHHSSTCPATNFRWVHRLIG